jgi:hypothetical protein
VRANSARTTPIPAGQRTSPVPETVTALTSTSSDESRKVSATRSSIAPSVSTTTGIGEPAGGSVVVVDAFGATQVVVDAAAPPPQLATDSARATNPIEPIRDRATTGLLSSVVTQQRFGLRGPASDQLLDR